MNSALLYSNINGPPPGQTSLRNQANAKPLTHATESGRRIRAAHAFLPLTVTIHAETQHSVITLSSAFNFSLDILVRIEGRCWLVNLEPDGTGSSGRRVVPESLPLEGIPQLQVCLRPGDEQ